MTLTLKDYIENLPNPRQRDYALKIAQHYRGLCKWPTQPENISNHTANRIASDVRAIVVIPVSVEHATLVTRTAHRGWKDD